MERVPLGNTGLETSRLGIGLSEIGDELSFATFTCAPTPKESSLFEMAIALSFNTLARAISSSAFPCSVIARLRLSSFSILPFSISGSYCGKLLAPPM